MNRQQAWLTAIRIIKKNSQHLRTNAEVHAFIDRFKNIKTLKAYGIYSENKSLNSAFILFYRRIIKLVNYNYQCKTSFNIVLECSEPKQLRQKYYDPLLLQQVIKNGLLSEIPLFAALKAELDAGKTYLLEDFLDIANKILAKFHPDSFMMGYIKLPFLAQFYDLNFFEKGTGKNFQNFVKVNYRMPLTEADGGVFLEKEIYLFGKNSVERFNGVKM